MTQVVILDYGSGNLRSAERALQRVGARVEVTADYDAALNAEALVVPGVGAFAACMSGLREVRGDKIIGRRLAGGRPVLGICVGMQILFDRGVEYSQTEGRDAGAAGCGEWPGVVERLRAEILPHMGWNTVRAPTRSQLFAGLDEQTRFYFVHSYAARHWTLQPQPPLPQPVVTWAEHGEPFVAAAELGPLAATQFHPEKSGDAGATLLRNWLKSLS